MYGEAKLSEILPEVTRSGAECLDLWPRPHGNQREQLDELGVEKFAELLRMHQTRLGLATRFDLGPFRLAEELKLVSRLGAKLVVCGAVGPAGLQGAELKTAVRSFVERLKLQLQVAAETGVTIAIENHDRNLLESADSISWLADFSKGKPLGVALAPYHLPQDSESIAALIGELGDRLVHFYAWQHGRGSREKQPRADEQLQLPGRGPLDFRPLLAALAKNRYTGLTEIFMHPFPRGVPIMNSPAEVTAEINRARQYLSDCMKS